MAGDIIPVIFGGTSGPSVTLPIDFGTLGGDVLHIQRILETDGTAALANGGNDFANVIQGNSLNTVSDSSGYLYLALVRTPGTRDQQV
jgi:hypothetical protein